MKFAPVPIVGSARGASPDAGPVLFSIWDTRVQDYKAFAHETKRGWTTADFEQAPAHPAVKVSWEDAQLFCLWLTRSEQAAGRLPADWRYRLPTDHEWSCAVGIGQREDPGKLPAEKSGKIDDAYPWGADWPPPKGAGNYAGEELRPALAAAKYSFLTDVIAGYSDDFTETSPVGAFAPNRFGLYDLGGNVRQWCQDWFNAEQNERVLRGSPWSSSARSHLWSSQRAHYKPADSNGGAGFRCVLSPVGRW
jgi:formylglycine-generating enzyme required for sulfatase activity